MTSTSVTTATAARAGIRSTCLPPRPPCPSTWNRLQGQRLEQPDRKRHDLGIENVNTGSGNDTIVASNAANIMDGGTGNDTFRFLSTTAADGDTILLFEPGDRLDLAGIDADTATAGNRAFTIVTGAALTAAGQLAVSFRSRADGDFTVVRATSMATLARTSRSRSKAITF
jgi:hypothetical protein